MKGYLENSLNVIIGEEGRIFILILIKITKKADIRSVVTRHSFIHSVILTLSLRVPLSFFSASSFPPSLPSDHIIAVPYICWVLQVYGLPLWLMIKNHCYQGLADPLG